MSPDPLQLFDRLEPPLAWSARADLDADPVAARILERVVADDCNVISLQAARRRRRGVAVVVAG